MKRYIKSAVINPWDESDPMQLGEFYNSFKGRKDVQDKIRKDSMLSEYDTLVIFFFNSDHELDNTEQAAISASINDMLVSSGFLSPDSDHLDFERYDSWAGDSIGSTWITKYRCTIHTDNIILDDDAYTQIKDSIITYIESLGFTEVFVRFDDIYIDPDAYEDWWRDNNP